MDLMQTVCFVRGKALVVKNRRMNINLKKGSHLMEIKLDDLKTVVDLLINKAKKRGIMTVELRDYYWSVPADERENITENLAPSLVVGSLVDDWEGIVKVINGINPPTIVDFERVGNILISVGESIYRSKKPL